MTTIVKIHCKGQMTLPTRLRTLAGIAEGDFVEAVFQRGKIVMPLKGRLKIESTDSEQWCNSISGVCRCV
ncbi:MAG: AbrB/MazE/SpoVT family DNA-binding domain-containing protein [Bryobacteraceae bacterium]